MNGGEQEPISLTSLKLSKSHSGPAFAVSPGSSGWSKTAMAPASLSQDVGLALGAQAGQARLTEVLNQGGFTRVRRAAQTPFNLVLEARL